MAYKTCKKCNEEELEWDHANHEITGRWRLMKNGVPHLCKFSKVNKYRLDTKYDLEHCGLCQPSHYGWCRHINLQYHMDLFHDKGQVKVWQKYG